MLIPFNLYIVIYKMVNSCSAFGCTNRFLSDTNIHFYRFPKNPVRKKLWILALRRKSFEPSESARICSEHFQTGRPSKDSNHPDYVPSIFNFDHPKKTRKNNLKRKETSTCILSNSPDTNIDIKFDSCDTTENDGFKDADELLSLKLELNEAFTDISTLRKENDILIKQLSAADETKNILHKAISEKEEELIKVKEKLQQAYIEIDALRMEKEELQKKLLSADVAQGILQDPYKLHFYTGLNGWKDFNSILSLLSDVENRVRSVPLETQLLIVLTKLKLNLLYADLAYRFQTSPKTVHRMCDNIIPPLETKIDLLVKCPISAALKKNIPVCFKNTVYENLYQRLTRYSKSKMKQFEKEEEDSDIVIL